MTPVTRVTIALDAQAVEMLDLLERATGANRSELLRRGVICHFLNMDKVLAVALPADQKDRAKAIAKDLKKK